MGDIENRVEFGDVSLIQKIGRDEIPTVKVLGGSDAGPEWKLCMREECSELRLARIAEHRRRLNLNRASFRARLLPKLTVT